MSKIIVWKVKSSGTSYLESNFENILDLLKDCDLEETYEITKLEINKYKYERLPEFMGF